MRHALYCSVFLALAAVHAPAPGAPTKEAEAYFADAMALIEDKHINSASADWKVLRAEGQLQIGEAKTTADTYEAISSVLSDLGEKHSYLIAPRPEVKPPNRPVAGGEKAAPLPHWGLVAGRIGLVRLPPLSTLGRDREHIGPLYAAELKAGLTAMDKQKLCGWIVDLRDNSGGNMWPMLQGLDPLLGKAPFGYFVAQKGVVVPWVRTANGVHPATAPVAASKPSFALAHQDARVAVLIGPRTASSGEMTALALIGRTGVRTFGAPSAGFTTANAVYPLRDGAVLVITETTVRDRSGKDYSGPIIPDEQVGITSAEHAASQWLGRKC